MAEGWIKLHRSALECPQLQDPVAFGVWTRMLLQASFRTTRVSWRGTEQELPKGCLIISVRDFADRCGVSYQTLRTLLAKFLRAGMIRSDAISNAAGSLITICNFDRFQSNADDDNAGSNAELTQQQRSANAQNKKERREEPKKDNPTYPAPVREPQPSLLPPAEPPPLKYAWEGTVIRLKADAFEKWQRMCPDLDLRLELQVRDDWLTSPDATKDHRDRWFITTSNYLGGRQRKAAAEKAERLRTTGKTTSRHEEANRRRLAEQHATDAGLCPHSPEWMQFASQAMKGGLVNGQQHRAA